MEYKLPIDLPCALLLVRSIKDGDNTLSIARVVFQLESVMDDNGVWSTVVEATREEFTPTVVQFLAEECDKMMENHQKELPEGEQIGVAGLVVMEGEFEGLDICKNGFMEHFESMREQIVDAYQQLKSLDHSLHTLIPGSKTVH